MRKILIAAFAATALIPTVASAQSAREVRQGQQEVRRDIARGDYQEAREDRQELREDWRDYRKAHRSEFRRDAYVSPRGMRYRQVAVGAQLNRSFWSRGYQVSDWNRYRLPRPGLNQQYIRYGNDVLLINARNGRVVRVFRDFYYR
ncbi:MAG: RcnB family protein [Croceibacterium sp.]